MLGHNAPPHISIVLPTFNGARYLAESVQSVIAQTLTGWELIIVDDCSTDETPDIIARFERQDPRIRGIRHETNRKLPAALNTGFAASSGSYLTWTSDDNRYRPQALQTLSAYLDGQPDVGLVYAAMALIDENGAGTGTAGLRPPEDLWQATCVGACFLYRRQVMETVGPYAENLFCAEDYDYWLRISSRFKMHALSEVLYDYRHHAQSLTGQNQPAHIHDKANTALERNMKSLRWLTGANRAQAELQLARWAFTRGARGRARSHLLRAARGRLRAILTRDRPMLASLLVGEAVSGAAVKAYMALKRGRQPAGGPEPR